MTGRGGTTERNGRTTPLSRAIVLVLGCLTMSCGGDGGSGDLEGGLNGGDASVSEQENPGDAHGTLDASKDAERAKAVLSSTSVVFSAVSCGATQIEYLTVANHGTSALMVSASVTGSAFSVNPAVLELAPNKSGSLTVTTTIPSSATAGVPVIGVLTLETNDPTQTHVVVGLSAIPAGATLAIQPDLTFAFPPGAIGSPASSSALTLSNTGNAPGTFTISAPESPFSLSLEGPDNEQQTVTGPTTITLKAGAVWTATAGFTPASPALTTATSNISPAGATCGSSETSIAFSGAGATGNVTGWPSTLDFGPSACGGPAPANQTFTLTNSGLADAHVTSVSFAGAPGFSTSVKVGRAIFAGGILTITVTAPSVTANSPVTPISGTLTMETDADAAPHVISLTEEPSGAILAFDTSPTPNFGSFGSLGLLKSLTQHFNVVNTGSAPALVTLAVSENDFADASSSPFTVSPAAFTIEPRAAQGVAATFTALVANGVTGSLGIASVTGPTCGGLPTPLSVSGSGFGGGVTIAPSSLSFAATCGGAAPGAQSFVVRNDGTADFTWKMTLPTGPGAAQYLATADPPPGPLIPGALATVTVTALAVPSPAPNPTPSAFAAELIISTDVPLDPQHVVSLGETPLGDQLSFSTPSPLRFGEIPTDTVLTQSVTILNNANAGSPAATVSFSIAGTGAGGYAAPGPLTNVAPGGTASGTITFSPTSAAPYPATLGALTSDVLCSQLPTPLVLSGAGT
jgi:hypothetical protein